MDESHWLTSTDPVALREFLGSRARSLFARRQSWATARKSQLFATACCRRLGGWLPPSFVAWLDWLDDAADGRREPPRYPRDQLDWEDSDQPAARAALPSIWSAMTRVGRSDEAGRLAVSDFVANAFAVAGMSTALSAWLADELREGRTPDQIPDAVIEGIREQLRIAERAAHAAVLRDIVGNPFRRADLLAEWRTTDAVAMARRMYDDRDFAGMPILADALEEAGCTDAVFLRHCREPGPHARGCWLVDAILRLE